MLNYPLRWPTYWPRIARHRRDSTGSSKPHHPTLALALDNLNYTLGQAFAGLNPHQVELTTNIPVSQHPLALNAVHVEDPGVSLWWRYGERRFCLPIDKYHSVHGNVAVLRVILGDLGYARMHSPELFDRIIKELVIDG